MVVSGSLPAAIALALLAGVVVILLALVYLGFIGQRGLPVHWRPTAGLAGAPLLGVAFGLGMVPCIGPVYGALLTVTAPLAGDGGIVGCVITTVRSSGSVAG